MRGMGLLWKCLFIVIPVVVFIAGCGIYRVVHEIHSALNQADVYKDVVSQDILDLFSNFDGDADNYLDVFEFQDAIKHFAGSRQTIVDEVSNEEQIKKRYETLPIPKDEEFITVVANFQPLDVTTMSKYKNELGFNIMNDAHFRGFKEWTEPFVPEANFTSQDFKVFVPFAKTNVGGSWDLIPVTSSKFERNLPHNRIHPSAPPRNKIEKVLTNLLTMLHPRPFLLSRFAPKGTAAVLRAINSNYLDIMFRIHAEFQINTPPNFSFWFTPAQFTGRLIINKNASHVEYFKIFVPTDKKLNVDMEWITGRKKKIEHLDDPWEMEVDIGFLPKMSLHSDAPSRKPGDPTTQQQPMQWDEEISEWQATRTLQKKLYPFQKILYRPFNETYSVAAKEKKLVHHILLWGALDDQSC